MLLLLGVFESGIRGLEGGREFVDGLGWRRGISRGKGLVSGLELGVA